MIEKIQIIQHKNSEQNFEHENITISDLTNPIAFDNYDVNIINLNSNHVWVTRDNNMKTSIFDRDFRNIKSMIINSSNSKVIIIYPQNVLFSRSSNNMKPIRLQYLTEKIHLILENIYPRLPSLGFEKNFKEINNNDFCADFYFNFYGDSLIVSDKSNKSLAIFHKEKIIATTLEIKDNEHLFDFLNELGIINIKNEIPGWFDEITSYDDVEQITTIREEKEKIKNSEIKIEESEEILEKNNHYKSILYTNSDELVGVVFEILEEILGCDLSEFNDERKEDFLIKFENNHVLIGEIKGVTSNVRFEHVGQVEQHYRRYLDNNPEYANETIKQVLIINYERKKKPNERHEIHEDQIKLAERNGCLIIDTCALLKIHESYLGGNIETEQLKEYIFNNSGLCNLVRLYGEL